MSKPTKQEYEDAVNSIGCLKEAIITENNVINKRLDEICRSRKNIEIYENAIEKAREIIYEFCQEEEAKAGDNQ